MSLRVHRLEFITLLFLLLMGNNLLQAQWLKQSVSDTLNFGTRIYSQKFVDANTGFAAGSQYIGTVGIPCGVIYKTVNGGTNWYRLSIPTYSVLYNIEIINSVNIVIACDTSRIIKTTNGGNTWTLLPTPNVTSEIFTWSTNFIDVSTGWISTTNSSAVQKILKTTNGGVNWIAINSVQGFTKMKFFDNLIGTGISSSGFSWTTNGGANWSISIQDSLIRDFTFLNTDRGWAYSKKSVSNPNLKGKGWRTINGGVNWSVIYSNDTTETGISGMTFFDDLNGYANNFNWQSGILKTTDGGSVWFNPTNFRLTISPNNVPITFANASTGWFTRAGTYYNLKTTTGPGNLVNPFFASYYKYQNSNNINNYIGPYGNLTDYRNPATISPGLEYPKGSNNYCLYSSSIVIGAQVNGQIRVSDSYIGSDFTPGKFDVAGNETGSSLGEYGLYQIKTGDGPGTPDWDNWPIAQGAPSSNGQPQLIGNQTSFISLTDGVRGGNGEVPPLKAELKITSYSFNDELRKDAIYYKIELINKSDSTWNNTYLSFLVDSDIGSEANDDRMGSDSALGIAYCYNGTGGDPGYGTTPPAVGYKFISGTPGLTLNSCVPFYNSSPAPPPPDPCWREPSGRDQYYNYQKGLDACGAPYLYNGLPKKFVFNGDPQTNTGWNQNTFNADVRFMFSLGPVNLAAGQSATGTIAVIVARGTSNLNSVTKLKQLAATLPLSVAPVNSVVPGEFKLNQNYPNPFNPVTKISYSVPKNSFVEMNVFDITGRLVQTLVSENLQAGNYEANFNGEKLSSGVYICRLSSEGYTNSIKMLLVK